MPDLTRTERDLLKLLHFREDLGTCYLAIAGRGREALVVPQMHTQRRARLRAFNGATSRDLVRRGLIEVATTSTDLGDYSGRTHLDRRDGYAVVLTDAGRAAVGGEGRG